MKFFKTAIMVISLNSLLFSACKNDIKREAFAGLQLGMSPAEYDSYVASNQGFSHKDGRRYYTVRVGNKEFYATINAYFNADSLMNEYNIFFCQSQASVPELGKGELFEKTLTMHLLQDVDEDMVSEEEMYKYIKDQLSAKYTIFNDDKATLFPFLDVVEYYTIFHGNDVEVKLSRALYKNVIPDPITPVGRIRVTYKYTDEFAEKHQLNINSPKKNEF